MAAINPTPASILADATLGINLLSGSVRTDIVGIFDQKAFTQVFKNGTPMKAIVRETSKVMDYPVETGATLSDHHIINPVNIEILLLVNSQNYAEVYGQVRAAFINATPLSVQTRTGIYQNMIIADMPHDEEPDMFDAIMLALHLREVIFVVPSSANQPTNYKPLDPVNASTVSRGLQLAQTGISAAISAASFINLARLFGARL